MPRKTAPGRRSRRWLLFASTLILLGLFGLGAFVGYNYYMYRTFWGNPNVSAGTPGTVTTYTFKPRSLGRNVKYLVYLPPGYKSFQNVFKRYPVVYLLHGVPGRPEDWVDVGGVADKMNTLIAQRKVKPMILVMPQGSWSQFSASSEYVNSPREGKWATYITRDLIERIDARYRTIKSADGRAIAGLSEGGFGATNLGLKDRSEFGAIGSFSGYFKMFPNDAKRLFGHEAKGMARKNSPALYLPHLRGKIPAFYLYAGRDEGVFLQQAREYNNELSKLRVTHEFHVYPGGHSWALWRAHLSEFLVFASKHLG